MKFLTGLLLCAALATAQPLKLARTIPLAVRGRIDNLAVDAGGKRLFIAAYGNNSVEMIDLNTGKVIHSIAGIREPQDVFFAPEAALLYVSSNADGTVHAFDTATWAPQSGYDFNSNPDNFRFDAKHNELFVGFGDGALGVINTKLKQRVGDIELDAHPEAFSLEQNGPRVFVNIPPSKSNALKTGHVSVIDRRNRSIVGKWPLEDVLDNYAMALDEANSRLFVGCRKPAELVVLDTATGKQIATVPIVDGVDDVFFDPAAKRIYASGAGGGVTVLEQKDPDHYAALATVPTGDDAHTSVFAPELKRLYVAVPAHGKKQQAVILEFETSP